MFNQFFKYPEVVARHEAAPYAAERAQYLNHCPQRGDSRQTLSLKASELLWVARRLNASGGLRLTLEQVQAIADCSWSRLYVRSVASELRVFFGFCGEQGWTPSAIVSVIQGSPSLLARGATQGSQMGRS